MQSTRTIFRATQRIPLTSTRSFGSTVISLQRVSELIKHDHRELATFKDKVLSAQTTDEKIRWQNQFTWELARHSIAEELVVYPAMERNIPGGESMAEKDRGEHQKVKELLYKFQSMSPDNTEFEPTLKALWSELDHHMKEEETEDLPFLEKHTKSDESEALATSFNRTKKFIPTRSHPSAPDRPPYETVAGLMTAPMDKLADMFRRFPKEA